MRDGFSDGVVHPPGALTGALGSEKLFPHPTRSLRDMRDTNALPDDDLSALTLLVRLAMPRHEEPGALAAVLLARFGSFANTLTASQQALQSVVGIGPYMLSALAVFREAAIRLQRATLAGAEILTDRKALYAYLSAILSREIIEQFHILFLGADGQLIADESQARGTVNHTPVYPREVVRRALELGASDLILVHNHPSGDPTPSADDIAMTGQVAAATGLFGIVVRDHVIVGNGRWFSFADAKLLDGQVVR